MTKLKRNYTRKTLKALFALSGNQCAYPECKNPVTLPATEKSDASVLSQICHIYALNKDGPRGKAGLTQADLNSFKNLILFCPTHHVTIDGQHETYPAELLIQWKAAHEKDVQNRICADLESILPDVISHPYFPTALVDQRINLDVETLRKSRFFIEFDRVSYSLALAKRLVEGELSGGSEAIKSRALSWCARTLSYTEESDKAEDYIRLAKRLGSCQEIAIADAFIYSQKGDKHKALTALARIDAPIARSAALMVVAHHDGSNGVIDWLRTTGINVMDLDSDGKYTLLTRQLELARWEAARKCLDALTQEDLRETPVLNRMAAITHLLITVPEELRGVVLNQIPFEAEDFPLASDAAAMESRRIAHRHFINSAEIGLQLNCPAAATIDDEYALWLELRDPKESNRGRQRLETKLRDPKSALRLVHLGLQFGIKLDLEAVEREIERQIALKGGITWDAAIARFALAFTQKTPENVANYIAQHFDELAKYFDKKSMRFLQVEMLSRACLTKRAIVCLNILLAEGLSEVEESRLRRIIAESEGSDPIEARKEQYKKTDSLGDLVSLVDILETRADWNGLCEYGQILFERTHSLRDAERWAKSLNEMDNYERLVEFCEANGALIAQSKMLQMLYCWSLYYEGELLKTRSELAKLNDQKDSPSYRSLQINLGISMGDWNSLYAILANECIEKDKRSAEELMGTAQLALHLGAPSAKELVFAAAYKASDDANILAAAYLSASSAGWEDKEEVIEWLQKAAALSGDKGPIRKMSLRDIFDLKPEWDRRESEIWQLLSRGEIPMFLAAQSLNRSLIDMMLFPALANLSEGDPRRRTIVPAYSGMRQPTPFNTLGNIAIDATALLTLSFVNVLDKALDAFEVIYLPHSTLTWLFEEKQRAAFHQPSRIRYAHQLRQFLATGALDKLLPNTVPNSDLSAQIGEELALLIAEAEKPLDKNNSQRIVVRSSPVHRVASLMGEEADLTEHAAVLSSCQAIVDKLRQKAQITMEEEKKARAYLQLHEKPWPKQPVIADGAVLYLDDLAITYFLHLGMLEKLQAAGFRPIASPGKIAEANEMISYESIAAKVIHAIDSIRSAVNSRIELGRIILGRRNNADKSEKQSMSGHPTFDVLTLANRCNAIISDDRFVNQHANNIDDSKRLTPLMSTLDLLEEMATAGSLSPEELSECRTLLRRAGYFFIPVNEDDLARHLESAAVKDGKVIETAELKAIRENILRVRMSTWLQLPKEAPWLVELVKTLIRFMKKLWRDEADLSNIRARSNWIMDNVDLRGWAHFFGKENSDNFVKIGSRGYILLLLSPPDHASPDIKDEYWSWIEDKYLAPIKEQYPDLYAWMIEWERRNIANVAVIDLKKRKTI